MAGPLDALAVEYKTLLCALPPHGPVKGEALYPLLEVRDRIAAGRSNAGLSLADVASISTLDEKLKLALKRIPLGDVQALEAWRDVVQPGEESWWWYHEKSPSPWWTVGAVLFLTFSVTLITDFTRRILSNDPDVFGILSIAVQALLAVAASSTFTDTGREWIEGFLSRAGIRPQYQPRWKLWATVVLFGLVAWAWKTMPGHLAWKYSNHGYRNPSSDFALRDFQRAVAMSPDWPAAHFNLGSAYEKTYQYDKAMAEYQETLVLNPKDVAAYANLSRLLVIANQSYTALRAADDGFKIANQFKAGDLAQDQLNAVAALHKDRAWAEFDLGFLSDAEVDARLAAQDTAASTAANCILGKIYTKEGKLPEAGQAWKKFRDLVASGAAPPVIEPDCQRLAEEESNAKK